MLLMGPFQFILFHDLPAESYSESAIKEKQKKLGLLWASVPGQTHWGAECLFSSPVKGF